MLTRISCRINDNHIFVASLYFLFQPKSQFEIANFIFPISIQLSLKTRLYQESLLIFLSPVAQHRILIGISEVALHLLLIVVAFCAPRGVCLFASCLQIPTEGFSLKHISIRNCYFALFRLPKPCSGFLSFSRRSNHLSWPVKISVVNALQRRSWQKICRGTSVFDA